MMGVMFVAFDSVRLVLLPVLLLSAAATPPPERVVAPDGRETLSINGVARTVLIDPAAPGLPIITEEFAHVAGLKPGWIDLSFGVGSEQIEAKTALGNLQSGTAKPYKRRVAYATPRYREGFDGVLGPASLEEPVIRFRLRDPQPGEHVTSLPMVGGGMMGDWKPRYALVEVAGEPMHTILDPHKPRTTTNAGGAVRLARSHGGQMSGAPQPLDIVFGISRPTRTMTLQTPLAIGPLTLNQLNVRTVDYGSTATIADADAPGDPDEVVVTGKGKRDPRSDWISIGADQLSRCSSIVFDKPAEQVRLSCL